MSAIVCPLDIAICETGSRTEHHAQNLRGGVFPNRSSEDFPSRLALWRHSPIPQLLEVLLEAGGCCVSFGFKFAEGGAVFVGEVVVPGEGVVFDGGEVVGYELLDSAAEHADGQGGSVVRWP